MVENDVAQKHNNFYFVEKSLTLMVITLTDINGHHTH